LRNLRHQRFLCAETLTSASRKGKCLRSVKAGGARMCKMAVRTRQLPMRVKDVMTANVIGVAEGASLWEALNTMVSRKISALIVNDGGGVPVGVLSEGDLMRRAEFGAQKKRPRWLEFLIGGGVAHDYAHSHGRRVDEIMTVGVISIDADEDISAAVDLMLEKKVRRLLVVEGGAPVGILSRSDLVRALIHALPQETAERSDAAIQVEIEAALEREIWAPVATVRVAVEKGVVTLRGAIADETTRPGLRVLVENVPGVRQVHDDLAWIEPNSGYYMSAPGDS
jgi:CBS domain-containing protein